MRLILLLAATAAIGVASLAAPARAFDPIDDFEIGSFSMSTSWFTNCVQESYVLNGFEPHVITQVRRVTLCGGDRPTSAYLDAGSQIDDAIHYLPGEGGDFLELNYNWGTPRSLTSGGTMNRIEIDLKQGAPGAHINFRIRDANGSAALVVRSASTPGIIQFPFSEFDDVNLDEAVWILIDFVAASAQDEFVIADIRLRSSVYSSVTQTVNYEGDFVAIDVPPVPSPPLSFRMTDAEGNSLYRTDLTITQADAGVINPCVHAEFSDVAALGGEIGGVIFMGIDPTPFIDTDFELTVDLLEAGRLAPNPEIVGAPSLTTSPFGFLITFPVRLTDVSGNETGRSETRVLFDVHEGQALKMENVQLIPSGASKQSASDGFVISFTLAATGDVNLAVPLFEATWIADWSPLSATDVDEPGPWDRPASIPRSVKALNAQPSVTREGTEIRLSAPLPHASAVEIFDVSGRLVRRLPAAAGAQSVSWDGRGASGDPASPGSYWARLAGAPRLESARIVRVR